MEHLLNLCWLLLAGPALLLWRRQQQSFRASRHSSLFCLATLGCGLVLLFPVISASDDLHALRQEMEESSSKVKVGESDRSSSSNVKVRIPPASLPMTAIPVGGERVLGLLAPFARLGSPSALVNTATGRAPPALTL
jgi:hypothetical protein